MAIDREPILEQPQPKRRWTTVVGGATVAIGLWLTLQILGMGIRLASGETDDAGASKGAVIGSWIWSLIAALIALFFGVAFARQLAATRERRGSAMP